jgi:hypothetical protein
MDMNKEKTLAFICVICLFGFFFNTLILTYVRKTEYTVEVYDIFEVVYVENVEGGWTCVYTYGQGQYFFRGEHDINASKSYSFTYVENNKRWRDLTLLDYREFTPLVR